jgi:hypothetical protein
LEKLTQVFKIDFEVKRKIAFLYLFFVCSKLTADCIVDLVEQRWEQVKDRFAHIRRLVINQDNGPENHSCRTQFMYRMVAFAASSFKRIIENQVVKVAVLRRL